MNSAPAIVLLGIIEQYGGMPSAPRCDNQSRDKPQVRIWKLSEYRRSFDPIVYSNRFFHLMPCWWLAFCGKKVLNDYKPPEFRTFVTSAPHKVLPIFLKYHIGNPILARSSDSSIMEYGIAHPPNLCRMACLLFIEDHFDVVQVM